jgi:hypothetical protein
VPVVAYLPALGWPSDDAATHPATPAAATPAAVAPAGGGGAARGAASPPALRRAAFDFDEVELWRAAAAQGLPAAALLSGRMLAFPTAPCESPWLRRAGAQPSGGGVWRAPAGDLARARPDPSAGEAGSAPYRNWTFLECRTGLCADWRVVAVGYTSPAEAAARAALRAAAPAVGGLGALRSAVAHPLRAAAPLQCALHPNMILPDGPQRWAWGARARARRRRLASIARARPRSRARALSLSVGLSPSLSFPALSLSRRARPWCHAHGVSVSLAREEARTACMQSVLARARGSARAPSSARPLSAGNRCSGHTAYQGPGGARLAGVGHALNPFELLAYAEAIGASAAPAIGVNVAFGERVAAWLPAGAAAAGGAAAGALAPAPALLQVSEAELRAELARFASQPIVWLGWPLNVTQPSEGPGRLAARMRRFCVSDEPLPNRTIPL